MFAFSDLEKMEKEVVVACFKVLPKYLSEVLRRPTKYLRIFRVPAENPIGEVRSDISWSNLVRT
jgi:hypothetical protein